MGILERQREKVWVVNPFSSFLLGCRLAVAVFYESTHRWLSVRWLSPWALVILSLTPQAYSNNDWLVLVASPSLCFQITLSSPL